MKLTLDSLREMGAFTGAPVERDITWQQGSKTLTATVYIRPLSYSAAVSDLRSIGGGDPAIGRLCASICDEKGVAVFTPESITGINSDGSPVLRLDDSGNPVPLSDKDGAPLLHDDGSPVYAEQGALSGPLTIALFAVIAEVNGLGKTES